MPKTLPLLLLLLLLASCAPTAFDFTSDASGTSVRVTGNQQVIMTADPLVYHLLGDDGHLVMWIENPTDQDISVIGDKSSIEDPAGGSHKVSDQDIAPHSSLKVILPPLSDEGSGAEVTAQPIHPYDQPGFIAVPGTGTQTNNSNPNWQWDTDLEIHIDLVYQQGQHQFEQNFTVTRVHQE